MELLGSWSIAWILALAIGSSYALTWLARALAPKFGLIDVPDGQRKMHARPTPLSGGMAVFVSLLCTVLVSRWMGWQVLGGDGVSQSCLVTLFLSAGLLLLLGLWDDRYGLRARSKFLLQILACLPFVFWGRCVESIHFSGLEIHLGPYGFVFTILWLVACTNMVNLMDGLDGLASAVGLISLVSIGVLSTLAHSSSVALISFILAANLVGFLLHNWPPARIFLGDAGSLAIGFFVGALSFEASLKEATGITLVAPAVLLSIPLFDTVMAMVRRKLNGRKIAEPDHEHMHHCFRGRGMTALQALLAISGLSLTMAVTAVVATILQLDLIAVITCLIVLGILVIARLFGYYESQLIVQRLQFAYRAMRTVPRMLDSKLPATQRHQVPSSGPLDLWKEVCRRFAEMQGTSLQLICQDSTENIVISGRLWRNEHSRPTSTADSWQLRHTIQRDKNLRVTLIAVGQPRRGVSGQRIDELLQRIDELCRCWPLEDETALSEETATSPILPFQQQPTTHTNRWRQDAREPLARPRAA